MREVDGGGKGIFFQRGDVMKYYTKRDARREDVDDRFAVDGEKSVGRAPKTGRVRRGGWGFEKIRHRDVL